VRGATRGERLAWRRRDPEPATIDAIPLSLTACVRRTTALRCSRCAARSTCPVGLPQAQRAAGRRGKEADTEPAQCSGRLGAAEESRDHARECRSRSGLRQRASRGRRLRVALETLEWLREHGFRTNPFAERFRLDRGRGCSLSRLGARRAELDYEIDGIVIKVDSLPSSASSARCTGGRRFRARVQVGADDGGDAAEQDPDPRGSYGCAQPVGDARAGRGRRRHRFASDAAQRGGHQPQRHPRRRRRDHPARRDRHPRRSSGRPDRIRRGTKPFKMPTHCPLCNAEIVKPEGEAMHRCPNRACPSAVSRR